MNFQERAIKYIIFFICGVLCIEVLAFIIFTFSLNPFEGYIHRGVVQISANEFEATIQDRDPVIGWPTKSALSNPEIYDTDGSRPSPANQGIANTEACISIFGDSFTYSEEVPHHDAWPNILANKMGCRVLNFGVGGYGSDQALLRLKKIGPKTPLTILALYPNDMKRNLTHNPSLYWDSRVQLRTFKPRYVQNVIGQLVLEGIPNIKYSEWTSKNITTSIFDPKTEPFIPGRSYARVYLTWPYTITIARILIEWFNRAKRAESWIGLLPEPLNYWRARADSIILNKKIINLFKDTCKKSCALMIVPDYQSIDIYKRTKLNINKQIYEGLKKGNRFSIIDPTVYMAERVEYVCEIFTDKNNCESHYNKKGYAMLARFVEISLQK